MIETTPGYEPASRKTAAPVAIMLPERAVIAVAGADAGHFLQNLLTADIVGLTPGAGRPAALLTPQGKIVADMLVFDAGDDEPLYLLDVNRGFADQLVAKLTLYRLRAEVSIEVLGESVGVMVCLDCETLDENAIRGDAFYTFADPRDPALGYRLYGPRDTLEGVAAGMGTGQPEIYHARRVALGIPEGGKDFLPADTFPHEANLDQLGGIDFTKGCYIGQEVVSRVQHRGAARTRALIVRCLNGFGVMGGAEIRAGSLAIGKIGECYRDRAITLIRLDRLEDARNRHETITAGGVEVEITYPEYVRFTLPGGETTS